jgi:FAD/FMN-containing dehydrogenase
MTELEHRTERGSHAFVVPDEVAELKATVRGSVVGPADPGYEEARHVWNAAVDRHPALIARCMGTADVVAAVRFAAARQVPVAVKGGGHNVAGNGVCDGGMVIDTSGMKGIRVDLASRVARAGAGVTWGEFDHETQAFGLATTGGICSEAGIAGVTLGAGFGWLMRKYGTSLDNLLSFDIVTPDGELRTASAVENSDLFFAVRGTHSNFGVVTSLEYRLHPVGPIVLAGMLLHPLSAGRDVLKFYRDLSVGAPAELGSAVVLLTAPDGNQAIALLVCYHGDLEIGEKVIAPAREFGPPFADMIQPMPYAAWQSAFDQSFPAGRLNYWKSGFLEELSDEVIGSLVDGFRDAGSPYSTVLIEHLGGEVAKVANHDAAFNHRDRPYNCVIMPMWTDPAESRRHERWADGVWSGIQSGLTEDVYVNYLGNEGQDRVRAAYGSSYERLRKLKTAYDPKNLFRFNQNIM